MGIGSFYWHFRGVLWLPGFLEHRPQSRLGSFKLDSVKSEIFNWGLSVTKSSIWFISVMTLHRFLPYSGQLPKNSCHWSTVCGGSLDCIKHKWDKQGSKLSTSPSRPQLQCSQKPRPSATVLPKNDGPHPLKPGTTVNSSLDCFCNLSGRNNENVN